MYLCVCVSVLGAVKASGESGYVLSKSDVSYHQLQRSLFHNNMSECHRSNEYISINQLYSVQQCLPLQRSTMMLFLDSMSIECISVSCVTERWYGVMFVSRLCNQKEQRLSFESETLAYWCETCFSLNELLATSKTVHKMSRGCFCHVFWTTAWNSSC